MGRLKRRAALSGFGRDGAALSLNQPLGRVGCRTCLKGSLGRQLLRLVCREAQSLREGLRDIGHYVVVALAREFRDLARGHGGLGVGDAWVRPWRQRRLA